MAEAVSAGSAVTHHAAVALAVTAGNDAARAARLARELGLPLAGATAPAFALSLAYGPEGLSLHDHRARHRPLRIDFTPLARPGARLTRRDPLARAVGRRVRTLVDATAGFGTDAMRLACLGLEVLAIERNPVIHALLRDGIERARALPALAACAARLGLLAGEAARLLPGLAPRPDAIYVDPMFPPKRRRSAATRRGLALLRELAGEDNDAGAPLSVSRGVAAERVIVKRPDGAPPLAPAPTVSYGGKLVRYDVYRTDLT